MFDRERRSRTESRRRGERGDADIGKGWDRKRTHRGGRARDEEVCTMDEADRGRDADVIGPGKVRHIHSITRFPFRIRFVKWQRF